MSPIVSPFFVFLSEPCRLAGSEVGFAAATQGNGRPSVPAKQAVSPSAKISRCPETEMSGLTFTRRTRSVPTPSHWRAGDAITPAAHMMGLESTKPCAEGAIVRPFEARGAPFWEQHRCPLLCRRRESRWAEKAAVSSRLRLGFDENDWAID